MPLRDHFRPPLYRSRSWEGFHGQWPAMIVQQLVPLLPEGYIAEPRVHLGAFFEIDLATFEESDAAPIVHSVDPSAGSSATAVSAPPKPTLAVETDLPDQYEYAVRIYDARDGMRLVAAIEIVSPANKDRRESRQAFVAKCFALLTQGVSISIVDVVTVRSFNLYAKVLEQAGHVDPIFGESPPDLYAGTCRLRKTASKGRLESWAYPLALQQPLPTIPVCLSEDVAVSLNLETSYEDTCRVLRLPGSTASQ